MAAAVDEALCIRHWDWSETSQTVALFTRDHGVVRALAKGSRRPKAPYSGGIELLTAAEIGLIVRPQSELALLTYWDLRRTFPALRTVLAAHHAGMYLADMILQFVRDHDPHAGLYGATLEALESMRTAAEVPAAVLGFQWSVLVECGFKPELEVDVRTGEPLAAAAPVQFHPGLGGLLASDPSGGDATTGASPRAEGAWKVRPETVALLRGLAKTGRPPAGAAAASVERANRLLASYARHQLGYQTTTMTLLFGDGLVR